MDDCVSVAGTVPAGSHISVDVTDMACRCCHRARYVGIFWDGLGWVGLVRFVRLSRGHCSGHLVASNWVDLVTSGKQEATQKWLCAKYPYVLVLNCPVHVQCIHLPFTQWMKSMYKICSHAWAMTKIMDEKHQHPYPKFHWCVPNNKTLIRQWWTLFVFCKFDTP